MQDLAASPRFTGSAEIAAARERCARELKGLGFDVRERPFEYSMAPGRFATPLFANWITFLVGAAGALALIGFRYTPALILVAGLLGIAVAARWVTRTGVLEMPLLRTRGVNLEATPPGERPTVWLCAHLDSKSQPIPSLARMTGTLILLAGVLGNLGLAVGLAADARVHDFFWAFAAAVTLVGWLIVVLSMVGSASPGAFDNASGVAAVVGAARKVGAGRRVGVLITDAEELGLAGARAWAKAGRVPKAESREHVVLNCDGVDDRGDFVVMTSGARPEAIVRAVAEASRAVAITTSFSRMLPGLLTDSVAFADAGHASVTFSRGTLMSLARVHSRRDNLSNLRGDGVEPMATLMAAVATRLAPQPS